MTNLHRLHRPYNQSPWLDNLSRELLRSGDLQNYINKGIRGLTSNPTILEKAILSSELYDAQIKRLAFEGFSTEDIYWQVAMDDIKSAAQAFLPLWNESDGEDGFVSLEVSPRLAHDAEGTLEQARWIWKEVNAPNLMVKVPATDECIPVIETLLSEGINVNVTLIFSLPDYKKIAQAHAQAYRKSSGNYARSVASFFISRIDSEVDARLDAIGTDEALALRGKAALAQAHLAYDIFLDAFAKSAVVDSDSTAIQRLLWASTSTKNPAYDELLYVTSLIAPITVNTLPEDTIEKILNNLPDAISSISLATIDEALSTVEALRAVGIDFNDVAATLEREGVDKFSASFDTLLQAIETKK